MTSCDLTIGQAGCFIVGLSMSQRHYKIDPTATPLSVDAILAPAGGYYGCIAAWGSNPSAYEDGLGLTVRRGTEAEVLAHLRAGGCALAEMLPASREHFVMVYQEGPDLIGLDPWPGDAGQKRVFGMAEAQSWRIVSVAVPPVPPVPHRDVVGNTGLHMQTLMGGWDNFTTTLKPSAMKFFELEPTLTCRLLSPDTIAVFRQHVDTQAKYYSNMDLFIDVFRDSAYNMCNLFAQAGLSEPYFYAESLNETYATGDPEIDKFVDIDLDFIDKLSGSFGEAIKPVVYCAAVGNVGEDDYPLLLPLARACAAAGGLWGYHNYWWANPNESGLISWWPWHSGRWQGMDEFFVQNGVDGVRYFGGESGGVGSTDGYHLNYLAGWKHKSCYNGDWNRYLADIVIADNLEREWNKTHGGRFMGKVLFSTGASSTGWADFQIRDPEMRSIAAALLS